MAHDLLATTPYGTTAFRRRAPFGFGNLMRRIESTDPEGGTERIEYYTHLAPGQTATVPVNEVPTGFADLNTGLDDYVSLRWDKKAMAEAPGTVARATVTRWLLHAPMSYLTGASTTAQYVPHSVKRPLETRVWYRYPTQYNALEPGT